MNFLTNPHFWKWIRGEKQCLTPEWQLQVLLDVCVKIISRHCRHIAGEIFCHYMQIEVPKKWSNRMKGRMSITFQGKICSWISVSAFHEKITSLKIAGEQTSKTKSRWEMSSTLTTPSREQIMKWSPSYIINYFVISVSDSWYDLILTNSLEQKLWLGSFSGSKWFCYWKVNCFNSEQFPRLSSSAQICNCSYLAPFSFIPDLIYWPKDSNLFLHLNAISSAFLMPGDFLLLFTIIP